MLLFGSLSELWQMFFLLELFLDRLLGLIFGIIISRNFGLEAFYVCLSHGMITFGSKPSLLFVVIKIPSFVFRHLSISGNVCYGRCHLQDFYFHSEPIFVAVSVPVWFCAGSQLVATFDFCES